MSDGAMASRSSSGTSSAGFGARSSTIRRKWAVTSSIGTAAGADEADADDADDDEDATDAEEDAARRDVGGAPSDEACEDGSDDERDGNAVT